MHLGLPFPTYLGWYIGPILTLATALFCIAKYNRFLKTEEKQKENK